MCPVAAPQTHGRCLLIQSLCRAEPRSGFRRMPDRPAGHPPYRVAAGTDSIYFALPKQSFGSNALQQVGAITLGLAVLHVLERIEIIRDDDAGIGKRVFVA